MDGPLKHLCFGFFFDRKSIRRTRDPKGVTWCFFWFWIWSINFSNTFLMFRMQFSFLELGAINDPSIKYHFLLLLLLLFLFFFSLWACPTKFSETDDPIFTKLHRKLDPHLKRCIQVLEFSKWPPLTWKPWTYVKIFDLAYIGNRQMDFHKTWHIY